MAVLKTTLCALLLVSLVISKPVSTDEDEDSSKASESTEVNSSEETEPTEAALTGTEAPNAGEVTDPPGTLLPSTVDATALPGLEDPQTSTDTDASQLTPDDPSHASLGTDLSQDMPETDPAQGAVNPGVEPLQPDGQRPVLPQTNVILAFDVTSQPEVTKTTTTTYQGFPEGTTTPAPIHIFSSSTTPPMPIPIKTTMAGGPVCFTFQFATSEPEPPRGDSV